MIGGGSHPVEHKRGATSHHPYKHIHRKNRNMKELTITLTLVELEALHKTLGIAIQNTMGKVDREGQHTKYGKAANSDLKALLGIQQEVLAALDEVA